MGREKEERSMRKRAIVTMAILAAALCAAPSAFAQKTKGEAGIGFLAISPPLADTLSSFNVKDMLYGVTVNYTVRPWLGVSTDVLYLGDLYYRSGAGSFTEGPLPWSSLTTKSGAKADWTYYESFIYAPLSINLMLPLGFIRPYFGLGPAFYFHFPSTNQDPSFTDYLAAHYGSASVIGRIGQGLTARVGFDIFLADSLSIGVGFVVREDTPATIFSDIGDLDFYKRSGYLFAVGRVYLK